MNFLGHTHVAMRELAAGSGLVARTPRLGVADTDRRDPSPGPLTWPRVPSAGAGAWFGPFASAYLLGAVLPDLASMARVRLDRPRLETGPRIRRCEGGNGGKFDIGQVASGVRAHLAADAVFHAHPTFRHGASTITRDLAARGLRRGAARAVGHIGWELLLDGRLVGTPAEAAFRQAMEDATQAAEVVVPDHRDRWLGFVERWQPWPRLGYDDPAWVAERVHDMLVHRERLAFTADQVPVVAAVLDDRAASVAAAAEVVVESVAMGMAEPAPGVAARTTGPATGSG